MGWEIVYFIVAVILSVALSPRPPDAKPAALEDFEFPVAEQGRPIPVIFGDVWVRGPNVLWYGGLWSKAIKKRSGFSKTTVGYKYYVGFFMGLCHGPINSFDQINVDEKIADTPGGGGGPPTTTNSGDILQHDLFGGEKQEGGLDGNWTMFFGDADQVITETYFSNVQAANMSAMAGVPGLTNPTQQAYWPAYRGIVTFLWKGGYIGTTKYLKPWAFEVVRTTAGWWNDEVWYPEKCEIEQNTAHPHLPGGGFSIYKAMNPAHIIYEAITNRAWGLGLSTNRIDLDVFADAADQLYDENFGLRFIWNQVTTIEQFIQMMLDHIAGVLIYEPTTGKFGLKLIRDDYVLDDLPLVDESNILSLDLYQRQAWGETINEVHIKYQNPFDGKDVSITGHDLANIQVQNGTNTETIEFKGIRHAGLAEKVLLRELSARSTPLAKIEFTMNRTGWPFHQGRVLKFSWEKLGISEMPIRVIKISRGTLDNGKIRIVAVQDIYSLDATTYLVLPPADNPPDGAPIPDPENEEGNSNSVISTSVTAPPGSPVDGDRYYIQPGTGTGAWTGLSGLVEWDAEAEYDPESGTFTGAWVPIDLTPGQVIYDEDSGTSVIIDTSGDTAESWTPSIDPMVDETTPELDEIFVPTFHATDGYKKVRGDRLGGMTALTPDPGGTYLNANIEVDEFGRVIAAEDGDSGGGGSEGQGSIIYLDASVPAGNTIANTATETEFTSSKPMTVALMQAGAVILFKAAGVYSTDATPPTLRIRVKLGTVTILDTTAFTTTGSLTNRGWMIEGQAVVTVSGASGQLEAQGIAMLSTGATTGSIVHMANTATVGVNMSSSKVLSISAQWGTADADNSIRMRQMMVNEESVGLIVFEDPVALLHFEAADGSTIFVDQTRKQWVPAGNAQIDDTQFKFGTSALYLDGTGDWVTSMSDEDFIFGATNFTIECFVRFAARSGNNFVFCFGAGWAVYTFSNQWAVFDGVSSNVIMGGTVANDTWYHLALVREGTSLTLYVDGVVLGTVTNSTNHTTSRIRLGASLAGSNLMNGWIDELRIHDTAAYNAAFTPPASAFDDPDPTFPEVSQLHFDDVDGSTTFTDVFGKTWTASGAMAIDTAQSKFGGSSLEDPSSAAYITTASSPDFGYGLDNFTIEFWMRPNLSGGSQVFYDQRTAGTQPRPCLFTSGGGNCVYYVSGANRISGAGGTLLTNTWHHIAVCRYNGSTKMFVDGVQVGSSYTDATDYEASPVYIGTASDNPGTFGMTGWYDELRIDKGHARYTEPFDVPNGPFPD